MDKNLIAETVQELEYLKHLLLLKKARRGDINAFTRLTKKDYQHTWYHELIDKYLNAFIKKEITRLMIFAPPRHGKSEKTSRRLPALWHGLYPNDEILAASYNDTLASDFAVDVQRILDSQEFKEIFPTVKIPAIGSNKGYARNSLQHELLPFRHEDGLFTWHTGSYVGAGIGGSFTGKGGNLILIDDPIKNQEDADSAAYRDRLEKLYSNSLRNRLEGQGSILITLTRWHDDDLAGRLLRRAKADPKADQWTILSIPAIREDYENEEDPRLIGEPLWPEKFPLEELEKIKAQGSRSWNALYQQRPVPAGGNIIQKEWIKFYKILPSKFDEIIQSWDFATKDKKSSDWSVGQAWGRVGPNKYLLPVMVRGQFSFPVAIEKVVQLTKYYPQANAKLVEAKANGPAIVQTLKSKISGFVEIEPKGDKISRLNAVSPDFESGNVWLPHPEIAPWVDSYISELLSFPFGANDDQVDTTTQALERFRKSGPIYAPTSGHGG